LDCFYLARSEIIRKHVLRLLFNGRRKGFRGDREWFGGGHFLLLGFCTSHTHVLEFQLKLVSEIQRLGGLGCSGLHGLGRGDNWHWDWLLGGRGEDRDRLL
jgi:hypothetical protein